MTMSKKDYLAIAQAFAHSAEVCRKHEAPVEAFIALDGAMERIAEHCAAGNPRFDKAKFIKACGIMPRRWEA